MKLNFRAASVYHVFMCVRVLICMYARMSFPGNSFATDGPVHDACIKGNLVEVKRLMSENPRLLNAKGWDNRTPLMYSTWSNNVDLVSPATVHFFSVFSKLRLLQSSIHPSIPFSNYTNQSLGMQAFSHRNVWKHR